MVLVKETAESGGDVPTAPRPAPAPPQLAGHRRQTSTLSAACPHGPVAAGLSSTLQLAFRRKTWLVMMLHTALSPDK